MEDTLKELPTIKWQRDRHIYHKDIYVRYQITKDEYEAICRLIAEKS